MLIGAVARMRSIVSSSDHGGTCLAAQDRRVRPERRDRQVAAAQQHPAGLRRPVSLTGVGSAFPAGSTARTEQVCEPSARFV